MKFRHTAVLILMSLLISFFAPSCPAFAAESALPSKFDPTTTGKVTPVRQSPLSLGICWAYATIGCIEQNIIYSGLDNASVDLSETSLVWFSADSEHSTPRPADRFTDTYVISPVFAMSRLSGLQDERDEPVYLDSPNLAPVSYSQNGLSCYELEKMEKVLLKNGNRDSIKRRISESGGAVVCYYNNDSCFSSDHKSYFQKTDAKPNHSVTVVGWDDDYSRNNFGDIKPEKNGAWLVKGVWGTRHENGFYWISYEEPEIDDMYFYKVTKPRSDRVYTHNGGNERMYASAENVVRAANVFTAESEENLREVSFMVEDNGGKGTEYTVKVYKDLKDGSPLGRVLCADVKGTVRYDGYYTVKLPSPVTLSKGEKFSVAVSIKSNNGNNFIVCEDSSCSAGEGESYYSSDGARWSDCVHTKFKNAYINAYTVVTEKPSTDKLKELVEANRDNKAISRTVDIAKAVLEKSDPTFKEVSDAQRLLTAAQNESESYVVIDTAEDWNSFATSVNEGDQYRDKTVVVTSDIDFKGKSFISAGYSELKCFNGYFDGGGHTFSNIVVNDLSKYDQKGVFGYIGVYAVVSDLVVTDAEIRSDNGGGIVGVCDCGTVKRCGFKGKLSGKNCGGIVGNLKKGTVFDCYSMLENNSGSGIASSVDPQGRFCVMNCFSSVKDNNLTVKTVGSSKQLEEMLNTNGGVNICFEHFVLRDDTVLPSRAYTAAQKPDTLLVQNKTTIGFIAAFAIALFGCSVVIIVVTAVYKRKKR